MQNDQLGTNLGPTWGQLVPKMEPRRAKMEPRRAKLEPSWANLGQLGPTWSQVGGQVGAKLATKSEKMGYEEDVKKVDKIWSRSGSAGVTQVTRILAPKNPPKPGSRGPDWPR